MRKCANPKCGKMFEPNCHRQIYCCRKCRVQVTNENYRKRVERVPFIKGGTNRPFTESTVYLIHKWYREGMSRKAIANMLQRDIKQIEYALLTPLSEGEKTLIDLYRR